LADPIALIVGLGNPGSRYEATRHNAGFWFLDALTARAHVRLKDDRRFFGEVGLWTDSSHSCRLLKPATYMNRSGVAVRALIQFFRVPVQQVLVVHDDLDLPPGTARIKRGGGDGGHNGLRDIVARLGDKGFLRLRLGIGHPGLRDQVIDYVLSRPCSEEKSAIVEAIHAALEVLPLLLLGDAERAMHRLHSRGPGGGALAEGT
jgi:peptidyl-tRNA hydrolase, PTH1 family